MQKPPADNTANKRRPLRRLLARLVALVAILMGVFVFLGLVGAGAWLDSFLLPVVIVGAVALGAFAILGWFAFALLRDQPQQSDIFRRR